MDRSLLHPRHWPSWLLVGLLRLIAALPFAAKLALGRGLGALAYRLVKRRRHIVEVNLSLCFPELTDAQREAMCREVFAQNGIGLIEIAWAWWADPRQLEDRFDVEGLEHVEVARADGKGVVMIGAHFVNLDLAGLMINQAVPIDVIYRKNDNPVLEHVITSGRQRVFENVLERGDMRSIIRKLRQGRMIWYSPDQDFGRAQSVFAPFFGVPAATLTTTTRLAQMGQANALLIFHYRDPATHRYRIVFEPTDPGFPTGDELEDAKRVNAMLERGIRRQPEQYMWVHRRFKTRPEGEASLY